MGLRPVRSWARRAVELRAGGLTRAEVARRLGVPEGSVAWVLHLRRRLSDADWEAYLMGRLSSRGAPAPSRPAPDLLREEVERLRAEKAVLEREVRRARAASQLARHLRKVNLFLEREEAQVEYLCGVTDLSCYVLEARRWIGTLERYVGHIRGALGEAGVIDVGGRDVQ